jgi:hypothetical protein
MNVRRYGAEVDKQAQADINALVAAMNIPTAAAKAW